MQQIYRYEFPLGFLWLAAEGEVLTHVAFEGDQPLEGQKTECTPLLAEAARQLDEYFTGQRRDFDLPLEPRGTPFQRRVWREVMAIPYGKTRSYKDVAVNIDNPKAVRAIGLANGRNPIAIIIPCHRVIGSSGKLTGYGGGLEVKQFLLDLEQRHA